MAGKPGKTEASVYIEKFKNCLAKNRDSPCWFHKKYISAVMDYDKFLEYLNGYEIVTTLMKRGINKYIKECE